MTKTKSTIRRDYRKIGFFGFFIFVAVVSFVFLALKNGKLGDGTSAASLASFQAGYIISDYQMTDYDSMSEGEIQDFLWSKGRCYNTNFSGVGTRVNYFSDSTPPTTWHVKDGHTVCLAEENMNGESAAHIIWQAARDYRINPKVLIVLIQKETGLITDPIPNSWDYQRTAGYGCPDTAACSEKYYGFKNQIRNAASLFRIVMDGNSSYYPIGDNYIQYNPNAGCGGSVVTIQNLATSALYRYTPYQPNAGALAAGYGTASCGAYGNRNFYAYFEDWFGNVTGEGLPIPESSKISEGEYTIVSAMGSKGIDVAGGSSANGSNVQLFQTNGTIAQKWQIVNNGDGSYSIKNFGSGKVIDVAAGSKRSNANVQIYQSNGSCAQKWQIVSNNDGTYSLYSSCSGMAMDVSGGSNSNAANIQIYYPNHSVAQKWKLVPVRTLDDGEYAIESVSQKTQVVDITGGIANAKNSTNVQIYNNNNTEAQKWKITYGGDGYYTILNLKTDKALDVAGGSTNDGANVQIYESNNTCAQKWLIRKIDGKYMILSACSGLALGADGKNVGIYTSNKKDTQKWTFSKVKPLEDGAYEIRSALNTKMVMDVAAGSKINGANIQLYTNNKTDAQKWQVTEKSDGTYVIKSLLSEKVLDVEGAGVYNGANVQQYTSNNTCAQGWEVQRNKDDTYTFVSVCSKKALDVSWGVAKDGANIHIYDMNGTSAQRWQMTKI